MSEPVAWISKEDLEQLRLGTALINSAEVWGEQQFDMDSNESDQIPLYLRPTPDHELLKLLEEAQSLLDSAGWYEAKQDCAKRIRAYLSKLNPADRKVP